MASTQSSLLLQLMKSGQFSDLTIHSGNGKAFKVHMAVVCTQLPVLHAALDQPSKEAHGESISIKQFRPSAVHKLIEFLYTGDYRDVDSGDLNDDENTSDNDVSDIMTPQTSVTSASVSERLPALQAHIRVNAIANLYRADSLATLTHDKIKKLLTAHQGDRVLFATLASAVELAMASGCDKMMHEILADAVAANMPNLVEAEQFTSFCDASAKTRFLFMAMKMYVVRQKETPDQNKHMKTKMKRLQKKDEEAARPAFEACHDVRGLARERGASFQVSLE